MSSSSRKTVSFFKGIENTILWCKEGNSPSLLRHGSNRVIIFSRLLMFPLPEEWLSVPSAMGPG